MQSTFAFQTSKSTYRVPTPPRIVVPPPGFVDGLPDITINTSAPFLGGVDYRNLVKAEPTAHWTYENRREAQMVLPYLFLGPMNAAKDEAWLKKHSISYVLGVRQRGGAFESKLMGGALRKAREMGIECRTIELAGNQELIRNFPVSTAMINTHLAQRMQSTGQLGRVLVFCESGNERSAGVVAAYLMETHDNVDHIKAMQLIQAQRFCTNFDEEMKRLLQGYWDILRAKRNVEAVASLASPPPSEFSVESTLPSPRPTKPCKRSLQRDDDDGDEAMDGVYGDDLERFDGGRRTFTPFTDVSME